MEFNEFALVVFFVTLCAFHETKTLILVLAILVCLWFLMTVNTQQLIEEEEEEEEVEIVDPNKLNLLRLFWKENEFDLEEK